jgi:hypothetical protein
VDKLSSNEKVVQMAHLNSHFSEMNTGITTRGQVLSMRQDEKDTSFISGLIAVSAVSGVGSRALWSAIRNNIFIE